MKKDIQIPSVSGVKIAAILEFNEVYKTNDWNIYIINEKDIDLEMVVVVSSGFNEHKITTKTRKKLDLLPSNSFAKIELIMPELFVLNNQFQVSFFQENQLFDKTFLFKKDTIKESELKIIPSVNKRGILAK